MESLFFFYRMLLWALHFLALVCAAAISVDCANGAGLGGWVKRRYMYVGPQGSVVLFLLLLLTMWKFG